MNEPPEPGRELAVMAPPQHPPESAAQPSGVTSRWPEIFTDPQPSIAQMLDEARTPEPGASEPPPWQLLWVYAVVMPVRVLGAAAYWVALSPARTAVAVVLALLVGTAAARVPDLAWIVPTWLDLTSWW